VNTDFSRIITLLRKERGISQKKAAADLGVSQALLSHYEKGIRECGLEFLTKIADYYNVSCDYLLGRCAEPGGRSIGAADENMQGNVQGGTNMLSNSLDVIFGLIDRSGSKGLRKHVENYFGLHIYRIFRLIYGANSKNDSRFFSVNESQADSVIQAASELSRAAASSGVKSSMANIAVTTDSISAEYPGQASSLLNEIKHSEEMLRELMPFTDDRQDPARRDRD